MTSPTERCGEECADGHTRAGRCTRRDDTRLRTLHARLMAEADHHDRCTTASHTTEGAAAHDGIAAGLRIAAALTRQQGADSDDLVHVGWWCWRGDPHGHLATMACRSDNVPIHVPSEWADDMRAVIQRIHDGDDPEETR